MKKYFYFNTNNGGRLPVVMNEDGSYTIFDQKSRKSLQSFTEKLISSLEIIIYLERLRILTIPVTSGMQETT